MEIVNFHDILSFLCVPLCDIIRLREEFISMCWIREDPNLPDTHLKCVCGSDSWKLMFIGFKICFDICGLDFIWFNDPWLKSTISLFVWLQMALLSVRMPIVGLHICYRLKCKFSIAFLAEPISCTDIAFALKAEKNSFPFPTYPSSSYSLYVANNKNSSEHVMHGRLCSINSIHIWSVFSFQAYKRRKAN